MAGSAEPPQPDDERLAALSDLGLPPDAITRATRRGDPEGAIFDAVLMPAIADRTVSAREIERRGGLSVGDVQAFIARSAFASRRREPAFTAEEASVLVELGRLGEVWPPQLDVRLGRVWGPLLARIAQAGVQLFRGRVEPRLRADDSDRLAGLRAVQQTFTRLLPLADPLLVGVYHRWIEHELAQAAATEAEVSAGEQALPGAVRIALLFCDLKDFTAFTDAEGDAAAAAAIDRFAELVADARGSEFRLMKSLGDGVMLADADAPPAVAAGIRIIDGVRSALPLSAHASVHLGTAIARDGDYFGGAVNLTARLLGAARHHDLVATRPVVDRTGDAQTWEPLGLREVRGVSRPLEVFRLASEPR